MLPIPQVDLPSIAAECRAALRVSRDDVAVFDADGTLWAPDIANRLWKRVFAERSLRSPGREAVIDAARTAGVAVTGDPYVDADALFAAYFAGNVNEEIIVRFMINGLAGLTRGEVDELVARALHQEKPAFADEAHLGMAEFVKELHAAGMRIVICSGSPLWAVEAGARALQLPVWQVLAGDVHDFAGRLSVRIREPLTYRSGKGAAYDLHVGKRPLFAFGDGESDIPLFERARILAVAVNPRPSLIRALPRFGVRARILRFDRTQAGRIVVPPQTDESID